MGEQYLNPPQACQPKRPTWPMRGRVLLDWLLPPRCVVCGGSADTASGGGALCRPCLKGLPGNHGACPGCGLPVQDDAPKGGRPCQDCRLEPPPWHAVYAPLRYDFPVDRLVRRLKFGKDLAAGRALAAAMISAGAPVLPRGAIIVPVPLHGFRRWKRGYNQAAEIAMHLARATGWPIEAGALTRVRHTRAQSGLHARERRRNLDGAFAWRGETPTRRSVVLVDDVMTTGSTLEACTHVLRAAGATSVVLWVAARVLGGITPAASADALPRQSASNAQRS